MLITQSRYLDLAAVARRRKAFQAKVDRDRRALLWCRLNDCDLNVEIPMSACAGERSHRDVCISPERMAKPQPVFAAAPANRGASFVAPTGAGSFERYPSELTTLAQTPSNTGVRSLPDRHQLASDRAERIAVDAELGACAGRQACQIESAWRSCPSALRRTPWGTCVVPGVVHRARHAAQVFGARVIADAVPARDDRVQTQNWSAVAVCRDLATKCRHSVVSARTIEGLAATFAKVCGDVAAEPKQCNHAAYRSKVAISMLLSRAKGVSSRL
jgi:hypothetical protein